MSRRRQASGPRWTIDAYETDGGEAPAWAFIRQLEGRNKGDGLFELRGKEVRLFYMFLPGCVAVLLDGETKKRDDIPAKTLARMRVLQAEVAGRGAAHRIRGAKR